MYLIYLYKLYCIEVQFGTEEQFGQRHKGPRIALSKGRLGGAVSTAGHLPSHLHCLATAGARRRKYSRGQGTQRQGPLPLPEGLQVFCMEQSPARRIQCPSAGSVDSTLGAGCQRPLVVGVCRPAALGGWRGHKEAAHCDMQEARWMQSRAARRWLRSRARRIYTRAIGARHRWPWQSVLRLAACVGL